MNCWLISETASEYYRVFFLLIPGGCNQKTHRDQKPILTRCNPKKHFDKVKKKHRAMTARYVFYSEMSIQKYTVLCKATVLHSVKLRQSSVSYSNGSPGMGVLVTPSRDGFCDYVLIWSGVTKKSTSTRGNRKENTQNGCNQRTHFDQV